LEFNGRFYFRREIIWTGHNTW